MGNSCTKHTIIEKSNLEDMYLPHKKAIHIWPEFQFQNVTFVAFVLREKGYLVITTEHIIYPTNPIQYNRVILYCENGIVKKVPHNG